MAERRLQKFSGELGQRASDEDEGQRNRSARLSGGRSLPGRVHPHTDVCCCLHVWNTELQPSLQAKWFMFLSLLVFLEKSAEETLCLMFALFLLKDMTEIFHRKTLHTTNHAVMGKRKYSPSSRVSPGSKMIQMCPQQMQQTHNRPRRVIIYSTKTRPKWKSRVWTSPALLLPRCLTGITAAARRC